LAQVEQVAHQVQAEIMEQLVVIQYLVLLRLLAVVMVAHL
jgi:hypothetical protein